MAAPGASIGTWCQDPESEAAQLSPLKVRLLADVREELRAHHAELGARLRAEVRDELRDGLREELCEELRGLCELRELRGLLGQGGGGARSTAGSPTRPQPSAVMCAAESDASSRASRRKATGRPLPRDARLGSSSRVQDELWKVFVKLDEEERPAASVPVSRQGSQCSAVGPTDSVNKKQKWPNGLWDPWDSPTKALSGTLRQGSLESMAESFSGGLPPHVPRASSYGLEEADERLPRAEGVVPSEQHAVESAPSGSSSQPRGQPKKGVSQFMTSWQGRKKSQTTFLDSASDMRVLPGPKGRPRLAVERFVKSPCFDYFFCGLIVLNALTFGAQTDYTARLQPEVTPLVFRAFEAFFCLAFTVELILRVYVHRCAFFRKSRRAWNMFDCQMVLFQQVEVILTFMGLEASGELGTFNAARMLRILRLIRVMRLVRFLRLVKDLRLLVSSIINSMRSLVWTVVLLVVMIYCVSLCLTQLVSDHRLGQAHLPGSTEAPALEALARYYGSLGRSMLSLFQAVTGGVDWDDVVDPLIQEISPVLAVLFALYVAFCTLAMMNVVTGIFVDNVLQSARMDKDHFLVSNAREIFKTLDGGVNGEMTLNDFLDKVETPEMLEFFKGIDVDPSEARSLFSLIDLDESGAINAEEFLRACVRLRGPAMALDTAVLVQRLRQVSQELEEYKQSVEQVLDSK